MVSSQTLSLAHRRAAAGWAADCAARVLPLFEAETSDDRIRDAIERAYAFRRSELGAAGQTQCRVDAGRAASSASSPAGAAAARAAVQAEAVAHMGVHALGAAAYAAQAAGLALPADAQAVDDEVRWQLGALTPDARTALRQLPRLGTDDGGPLGFGLLTTGVRSQVISIIQAHVGAR
ncbi:hypothetical protein M3B11_04315 [Brevibacterium sp. p3-SID960]|uniref:putative immunity protein n=1 Tax=Brevibacterium sp. p3-SID960 TaxID=2916063 RepID=UPI0021A5368A|nr:hypothetical protein [Brevibacterium sp. p3-SID960]MCT1690186.1 hypothetical protein [Brevibacterium sp. p3-SID960]